MFMLENELLRLKFPHKINFMAKQQCGKFSKKSTCIPSIVHRRDFSFPDPCSGGLKTLMRWIWLIFINIEKFLGFLTSLKEAHGIILIIKSRSAYLEPLYTYLHAVGDLMSRWGPKSKSLGTKNWKGAKGVFRDPYF